MASPDPTLPVHIDFRKWGGAPHWQLDTRYLGEDEHGIWVWGPEGTVVSRQGVADKITGTPFVILITHVAWWLSMFPLEARHSALIDITTPAEWEENTATLVDLDLDVVVPVGGEPEVEDEDEFAVHQKTYAYPQWVIERARTTTAEIVLAVEADTEPFRTRADQWLRQMARLRPEAPNSWPDVAQRRSTAPNPSPGEAAPGTPLLP